MAHLSLYPYRDLLFGLLYEYENNSCVLRGILGLVENPRFIRIIENPFDFPGLCVPSRISRFLRMSLYKIENLFDFPGLQMMILAVSRLHSLSMPSPFRICGDVF